VSSAARCDLPVVMIVVVPSNEDAAVAGHHVGARTPTGQNASDHPSVAPCADAASVKRDEVRGGGRSRMRMDSLPR
jgi:hypothetical protein